MIENVFVIPTFRESVVPPLNRIIGLLEEKGRHVLLQPESAARAGRPDRGLPDGELLDRAHVVLSLGGDGTLLRAARMVSGRGIPILGVNLGSLGFLTEVSLDQLDRALEALFSGDYRVVERMMLEASVMRDGRPVENSCALNDVVLHRKGSSPLLHLSIGISGRYAGSYSADGLIISTPTGSTAYSLSAGGPIVSPDVDCFILTAICPHTLSARPLVIPASESVEITETHGRNIFLSFDGQVSFEVEKDGAVLISRAGRKVKFIDLGRDFYRTVREKLKWVE
jgi:NAD+ kinase